MAYEYFKDLRRGTVSHKILRDKACNIPKSSKDDRYQHQPNLMDNRFFDKNEKMRIKNENLFNKELAEQLHKPIIGKFKKRKVH